MAKGSTPAARYSSRAWSALLGAPWSALLGALVIAEGLMAIVCRVTTAG